MRTAERPARPVRALLRCLAAAALAAGATGAAAIVPFPVAASSSSTDWVGRLEAELARIDPARHSGHGAAIGVYVRDLASGTAASHRLDEDWYFASTVKVPIAIAVLRGVDRGAYSLDMRLAIRASDFVDGAGQTVKYPVGASLSLRYLLEQMIIYSDNTASDMLIGLVGIDTVNALVQELVPQGFGRITTLADVRRHAYGELAPEAARLTGYDFLLLKAQRNDTARRNALGHLLKVPTSAFRLPTVGEAFEAYYQTGLNSGRLDAYADLLALLQRGRTLSTASTKYLLGVMERVKTGQNRIRSGLPPKARFAHKTGTQRARSCDSGIVTMPRIGRDQRVIVVACTRGELSTTRSDLLLRQVGAALCRSGLLTEGKPDEPVCLVAPPPLPGAVAD